MGTIFLVTPHAQREWGESDQVWWPREIFSTEGAIYAVISQGRVEYLFYYTGYSGISQEYLVYYIG